MKERFGKSMDVLVAIKKLDEKFEEDVEDVLGDEAENLENNPDIHIVIPLIEIDDQFEKSKEDHTQGVLKKMRELYARKQELFAENEELSEIIRVCREYEEPLTPIKNLDIENDAHIIEEHIEEEIPKKSLLSRLNFLKAFKKPKEIKVESDSTDTFINATRQERKEILRKRDNEILNLRNELIISPKKKKQEHLEKLLVEFNTLREIDTNLNNSVE